MMDGLSAIKSSPLFGDLDPTMQRRLADLAPVQRFAAGDRIYDAGSPAAELFLLIDGTVVRTVGSAPHQATIGSVSDRGAFFGGSSIGDGTEKRLTSAVCKTNTILVRISQVALDAVCSEFPEAGSRINRRLYVASRRLQHELGEVLDKQAAEIAQVKSAFEERINLEQLLTLFVSTFINLDAPNVDNAIQSSMALLANYFGANQIAVYVKNRDSECLDYRFGWHSHDLTDSAHLPARLPVSSIETTWQTLTQYESVVAATLDDLPAGATPERADCAARGVQSLMRVPMLNRGSVDGFLSIETVGATRQWPTESVSLLRILGEVILNALTRKELNESLHRMAHYDQLTGLANRTLYRDLLVKALARAERHGDQVALLYLDLDRFKWVNDSLGHAAGDQLLKGIAERLCSCIRQCDTVARLGGDEFTIIMEALQDHRDIVTVADKVLSSLRQPFVIDGQEIRAAASIGIATYPICGGDPDAMTQYADMAMYKAKEEGRGSYHFFSPQLNDLAQRRLNLESSLQRALERNELELFCQPQISAINGRMVGAEALIRWRDPERGIVSPGEFLPVAEDTGLIVPMSEWILSEACRQRAAWRGQSVTDARIAVNVTGRWLKDANFVRSIDRFLSAAGLPPTALELELTEEILLSDVQANADILHALREWGIEIALDDFGTGYSSLSYLRTLPIDLLKIDQSFVRNLENSRNDTAIVSAMISLGHNLDLKVVAEGVETEAQHSFLRQAGCDIIQGYLVAKPQPEADFLAWMTAQPSADAGSQDRAACGP